MDTWQKKCCSVSIYIYGKLIDIPIFYPRLTYGINMNHLNPKPNTRKLRQLWKMNKHCPFSSMIHLFKIGLFNGTLLNCQSNQPWQWKFFPMYRLLPQIEISIYTQLIFQPLKPSDRAFPSGTPIFFGFPTGRLLPQLQFFGTDKLAKLLQNQYNLASQIHLGIYIYSYIAITVYLNGFINQLTNGGTPVENHKMIPKPAAKYML